MAEELAYAIDGLDSAYSDLMEVADGKLTGLGEVGELAGDATEEEREFAKWHADLGESTKRFINATSEHIKREGSTGIDNFIAGGEAVQMCDYLVKHWDKNRDGALDVIQEREEELIMNGRMHGLESVSTALGYRVIPPIARTPNELLSGIMYSDLEDGMRFDHKAGLSGMWDDSPLPDLSDEEWTDVGVLFGLVGIDDDGEYFEVEGVLDDVEHYVGELGLAGLGELEGWFSRLKKKIRRAARKVRRSARKIGRRVKRSFRKAGRWTRRTVRRAGRAVKRGFRKIGRGIKKAARWAAKKSSGVFKKLRKIFKKSVTFVRNGVTYVWDKTKGLMKKVGKALVKAGKAIAHAMVWLGKKIKEIAVKFARLLNPKNIIARTTLLRRTRKGRHGLANNMYYGMVGWTKAKQMGASRKDYEDSKAAYDKCLRNLRKWGSGRRALNKAIRKGYDPKRVYNPESKEQLKRSVKGEVGHMDKKAIVAKEQNAVYKKHGVSESERKALSGGLGLATMVIIAIISLVVTIIMAIIKLVIALINKKKQEKEQKRKERELKKEKEQEKKEQQKKEKRNAALRHQIDAELKKRGAVGPNGQPLQYGPDGKLLPQYGGPGALQQASMMKPLLIGGGLLAAAALVYKLVGDGQEEKQEQDDMEGVDETLMLESSN